MALGFDNDTCEIGHLFWVDDDVIPINKLCLCRLLEHERDIASGVYFLKSEVTEPLIFPSRGGGTGKFRPGESFETWGHGMGLTLVNLDVYRRMNDELKLPLDKYGSPEWYRTPNEPKDMEREGNMLWCSGTEDLYFLHNASKIGIQAFVDCSRLTFGFHYDLVKRKAYPQKQWEQYVKGKPIEWDTPEGIVKWE